MKQTLTSLVQYLFFFTALVLTAFGVNSMFRVSPNPDLKMIYMMYAILILGDALAMLFCGLLIKGRIKAVFWFAATILSLDIVLTIFDQFGLIDFLFSLLNIITLTLLLVLRKEFLPQ
jgi:hypothetical protein